MTLTRRDALRGLGAAVGVAAVGCGDNLSGERPDLTDAPRGGRDASPDAPSVDQLLGSIDHVVVLCMENRSFDHYLGALRLAEGRTDVDGLRGTETNPAPGGGVVAVHRLDDFTPADPPHDWDACHQQWNQGANDGFVRAHAGADQADVMGYHLREHIPVTYALADGGCVCQRWFSSVMGPTWPNRFYLHGATSHGIKSNLPYLGGFTSVFDRLDDAGRSHRTYYHDVPWAVGAYRKLTGNAPIEQFFDDAAAGALPDFTLIDPGFFGSGANDDHPDHDIRLGQALLGAVVNALGASPHWPRCLLVITYDEHGGFYDHVAPPTTFDQRAEFGQLGFRVPSVLIGPTVRRRHAASATFEHVSVIATLTRRFGLEPINDRVRVTADLSPCIDPARLDDPAPPPVVPAVVLPRDAGREPRPGGAHAELAEALAAMDLPPGLDRRARSAEVIAAVLDRAARLGAVRWRD